MNGLLSFQMDSRRVWMFPRNIRDIAPWKLYQIINVLMQCDDVNQYSGEEQKMMYRLLEEAGIKKKSDLRDKNPGGMRTYLAQLATLGLVFRDEGRNSWQFTIAGEMLANNEGNPMEILQYQLLRHQYPSAYGFGTQVRIDPRMKVKPFMFLIRLLHDERIDGYLTNEDAVIPVVYGHNDSCYEFVVEKILELRRKGDFNAVIENPELDFYTPKGSPDKALGNMKDIANTAINYLKAASLVLDEKISGRKTHYIFNMAYEKLYQQFLDEKDNYIPISSKNESISFQRAYGRYTRQKDNRNLSEFCQTKESPTEKFATFKYIEYLNDNLFEDDTAGFVADMVQQFGIPRKDAMAAVNKLSGKKLSLQENTYLDYAFSGGQKSNEFEKATKEILVRLGFENSRWIGRMQSKQNWRGNFPDVFIQRKGCNECGLADTKATSSYSLGHADMLKMKETYVKSNEELSPGSHLVYFIYIAGGFSGDINGSLWQLTKATGVNVSAIDARGLLMLLRKNWSPEQIEEKIFKSGEYIAYYQIETM